MDGVIYTTFFTSYTPHINCVILSSTIHLIRPAKFKKIKLEGKKIGVDNSTQLYYVRNLQFPGHIDMGIIFKSSVIHMLFLLFTHYS